jgi:hypothetical protein
MRQRVLNHDDVHLIRTSGMPDRHWANLRNVSVKAVRAARIGQTWHTHPTPPDAEWRLKGRRLPSARNASLEPDRLPGLTDEDRSISRALTQWPRVDCSTPGTGPLESEGIS